MPENFQEGGNPPENSQFLQRLNQRLVRLPGVINKPQLHTNYQQTQTTVGRLIQRLTLPEQTKSRYSSGILQPMAISQHFKRLRLEVTPASNKYPFPSFSESPIPSTTVQKSELPKYYLQSNLKVSSQSQPPTLKSKPSDSRTQPPQAALKEGVFKISKQATIAATNNQLIARSSAKPQFLQQKSESSFDKTGNSFPLPQSTAVPAQLPITPVKSNQDSTANPIISKVGLNLTSIYPPLRISRQAKIAAVNRQLISTNSTNLMPLPKLTEKGLNAGSISNNQLNLQQNNTQKLPFVERYYPASTETIKTQPRVQTNSLHSVVRMQTKLQKSPVTKAVVQTKIAVEKSETLSKPVVRLTTTPKRQSKQNIEHYLMRRTLLPPATLSPLSLDSSQSQLSFPLPNQSVITQRSENAQHLSTQTPTISSSSNSNILCRESSNNSSIEKQVTTNSQLPLAIALGGRASAIADFNSNSTIARKTDIIAESTVDSGLTEIPPPARATSETTAAMDIQKIAQQVSRILTRQLAVERERRGINKWH
ncbi:MAG: hypothetical protein F6K16_05785 [Symploca sp. SIO2B6]|nr:hypothetical protein [Symploca sp. SIO2B6]